MNKKILPIIVSILVLALLVASSGCVSQNSTTGSAGLIIKSIYTDPPEDMIHVGESIRVFVDIENVGSNTAKNVIIELFGANWVNAPLAYNVGDIQPPSQETASLGQTKRVVFTIPAPTVPEGRTVSYPLTVKLTYNYGSSGVVVIPGYSTQRYERDVTQGKLTKVTKAYLPVQQSTLPTPIKIDLTGPDKIVVTPYAYDEVTYHITFTNVGEGIPVTNNEDGLIYGGIWVTGPGVYFKDCIGVTNSVFSSSNLWSMPAGAQAVQDMFTYYYRDKNVQAYVYKDDTGWTSALSVAGDNFMFAVNAVGAYARYPTILDWQFLGNVIPPLKLRTSTSSVTMPCTIAIDNAGSWKNRESDTISLNFDLRYIYTTENKFSIQVTAPVVKNPAVR